MSNNDKVKGKISNSEYEQIKNKYPERVAKFEEVKKGIYEPQIERLGEDQ